MKAAPVRYPEYPQLPSTVDNDDNGVFRAISRRGRGWGAGVGGGRCEEPGAGDGRRSDRRRSGEGGDGATGGGHKRSGEPRRRGQWRSRAERRAL